MIKEKFIVLDTETTNSLECPLVYDIGFAVVDEDGKVYETHSFAIKDIINRDDLMSSAYYIEKLPNYWAEIERGERVLQSFDYVYKFFKYVCKKYYITKVFAHNMRFDYMSLNNTLRYLTTSKMRYFFSNHMEICDTLRMAREVFADDEEYTQFCIENDYLTSNKQNRYTAEIIYRYLTNNNDFTEIHTGLEDVLIEKDILCYCLDMKPNVNMHLWNEDTYIKFLNKQFEKWQKRGTLFLVK